MSVAFAAPRQRGKGEITPAAIQKVKPRGDGDARPIPPLGETPGGRAGVGRAGGGGGPVGRRPCGNLSHGLCLSGWRKTANRFSHRVLRALGLFPTGTKAQVTASRFL